MMRARALIAAAAALAVAAAVLLTAGLLQGDPAPPRPPSADGTPAPASSSHPPGHHVPPDGKDPADGDDPAAGSSGEGRALTASAPVSLSIPSLGVTSPLERLGRGEEGAMETPADHRRAGWYAPGPTPGERGPAVIAGHVTWNGAKSVFYRLGELRAGDVIDVERADGRTASFEVQRTERFPKSDFPTVEVYRNLDHPGLRLITCGGEFDEADHYYADNVVVFAALTEEKDEG